MLLKNSILNGCCYNNNFIIKFITENLDLEKTQNKTKA